MLHTPVFLVASEDEEEKEEENDDDDDGHSGRLFKFVLSGSGLLAVCRIF